MTDSDSSGPALPRRAFVAAALSAVFAGGAVTAGLLGGLTQVHRDSFQFSRGTGFANGEEARLRGMLAQALPDERMHVTILAHTGETGDAAANQTLSDERADLVAGMARALGIAADRITARGLGGSAPLAKNEGESDRAFQSRLARVEVTLQLRK